MTKQIALTQKLLTLFIDYQIPSDLLAYDGSPNATTKEKLDALQPKALNVASWEKLPKVRSLAEVRTYVADNFDGSATPAKPRRSSSSPGAADDVDPLGIRQAPRNCGQAPVSVDIGEEKETDYAHDEAYTRDGEAAYGA